MAVVIQRNTFPSGRFQSLDTAWLGVFNAFPTGGSSAAINSVSGAGGPTANLPSYGAFGAATSGTAARSERAQSPSVLASMATIEGGKSYSLTGWAYHTGAGTKAALGVIFILNGSLSQLEAVNTAYVPVGTATWTQLSGVVTAPANATHARIVVDFQALAGTGDWTKDSSVAPYTVSYTGSSYRLSGLGIMPLDDPLTPWSGGYFDGAFAAAGDFTYGWEGTAYASPSYASLAAEEPIVGITALTTVATPQPPAAVPGVTPKTFKPLQLSNYSLVEDSTPIDPSDTTGGTGQFTLTFDENDETKNLLDVPVDLVDNAQGTTTGTVRGLASADGSATATADSRMNLLAVERIIEPFVGTLGDYFEYLLELCDITTNFVVDTTIASRAITMPGANAVVWDWIKKLAQAQQVEASLVSNNVVLRALRGRTAENYRDSSHSWGLDTSSLARSVEVNYYSNTYSASGCLYPPGAPITQALRTNYAVNPNFETATTGWTAENGAVLTRDTTSPISGTASGKITGGGDIYAFIPTALGERWTISFDYRTSGTVTGTPRVQAGFIGGGVTAVSTALPLTQTTAARFSVTSNPALVGSTSLLPVFFAPTNPGVIFIDNILIEKTTSAGTYFDGSTATTTTSIHAWTGATNGSTSTEQNYTIRGGLDLSTSPETNLAAGEVRVVTIPVDASIIALQQPSCESSVLSDYVTSSVYTVSGNDGLIIPPAQWAAGGGNMSFAIGEDTKSVVVTITASVDTQYAPYSILMPSGTSEGYNSLRIVGEAIFQNKQTLTLNTGVDHDVVSNEVGATIDNEMISTLEDAYHAGLWALKRWGSARHTVSVSTTGINRTGDTGSYAYPTIADFNAAMSGQTITNFNTLWSGMTFQDFNDYWASTVADDFANQAFGNIAGARVRLGDSWFRIRNATVGPYGITYTAEEDSIISDFNTIWAGKTIADFNAQWTGKTFNDFAVAPMKKAA